MSLAPAISGIQLAAFKSFEGNTVIPLKPLTVLAGANSSGKSSAIQPLLLLKQTLEAPYTPVGLHLVGEHLSIANPLQLAWRRGPWFSIGVLLDSGIGFESKFALTPMTVELEATQYFHGSDRLILSPLRVEESSRAIEKFLGRESDGVLNSIRMMRKRYGGIREPVVPPQWAVTTDRCFALPHLPSTEDIEYKLMASSPFLEKQFAKNAKRVKMSFLWELPSSFAQPLLGMIHVPGLRGNPARTYPVANPGPNYPGPFHPYVAAILALCEGQEGKQKLTAIGKQLSRLGLTWKVAARRVSATDVELQVGRLPRSRRGGARDLVNIADVGWGVSQILPVLVALLVARPGQTVILEQPEIHLHPRSQVVLGELLTEAVVERGIRLIVETHSSLLLRSIQTRVATGAISAEKVALHWFTRDQSGSSSVRTADLDSDGSYGDWPEDFGEIELESHDRYLAAVDAQDTP